MTTTDSMARPVGGRLRTNPMWQVRAEIMKIRTTRLWWMFLLGVVAVTALALVRNGATHHYDLHPPLGNFPADQRAAAVATAAQAATYAGHATIAADMMTSGQFFGVLLAMLLGVLIVTNESAHGTAAATFLTNPHRGAVAGAKFVAAAAAGVLFWLVSTLIDLIVTPFYLRSQGININLADWVPLRSVLLNLLVFAMWAVFGVGLGSLFRSQVGAVLTALLAYLGGAAAVLVVFNLIYQAYHHAWVLGAPVIAPAVAALVMITPGRAFDHAPPQWAGLIIFIAYTLVLGLVGILRTRRRDI